MIARIWKGVVAAEDADGYDYPEDDRYLIARDEHVTRHTVAASSWTRPTVP